MADYLEGTTIVIAKNVFWKGKDISGRKATVLDSESYVLVELDDFVDPVKLFRSEISHIVRYTKSDFDWDTHLD